MSWITVSEKKVLEDLQLNFEKNLMFGGQTNLQLKKRLAKVSLHECLSNGLIDLKLYLRLIRFAESNDLESVELVLNILNEKAL